MNEKQLSKSEIQQLFQFMKKHGIKFYDIQLEMVDHFASEIEQRWEEYPDDWTFENKILDVYRKIGSKGFKKIEREKYKSVQKWFNGYFHQYIKSFFSWPTIVVAALLFFLFFSLITSHATPYLFGEQIIIFLLVAPFFLFFLASRIKDTVINKKVILNLSFIRMYAFLFASSVYTPLYLFKIIPFNKSSVTSHIALSCYFIIILCFSTAYLSALINCYKDFKLKYPKLV